ncbi:MAG: S41 family peptidase [Bacteroidota bacterium]
MIRKLIWCIPVILLSTGLLSIQAQENEFFVRHPSLNSDGSQIAFSYQGDIWIKDLDKPTMASRLTIHEGYDGKPQWSPDDTHIAFTSDRYGNKDVFTIKTNGSETKRLTYHSTNDQASDWLSEDEITFTTNRTFGQVEREEEVYKVSLEEETPQRILNAVGYTPVLSPNKRFIAFVRGSCKEAREAYKGPANKDIWIYDKENDAYQQITTYKGNDFQPRWVDTNTLYFISSRNGKYNIFKVNLDNNGQKSGSVEALTNAEENGIRYFDVSPDGSTLAFEKGIDIYVQKETDSQPQKLALNLTRDYRYVPTKHKTYTSNISNYTLSPNGKQTAFVIRGELFLVNNKKEKTRTVRLTDHPYRDFDLDWVNDSTLLFVSDRSGQKDLYLLRSSDPRHTNLYKSLKFETIRLTNTEEPEGNPTVSPDGSKIAFVRSHGTLITADINTEDAELSNLTTLRDGWASPGGLTWSPDSKWLAYSLNDLNFNSEIYIHDADDSKGPVNVSMHPKGDYQPFWSPDGSKLGFLSERNNGDRDLWFAWLKKEDWQKTMEDWQEMNDEDEGNDKDKTKEDSAKLEIDLEDIHQRLQQVTSLPGNESDLLISKDGETFYFVSNRDGRRSYQADEEIYSVKWDGEKRTQLTDDKQGPRTLRIDHNSGKIYLLRQDGKLAHLNPGDKTIKAISVNAEMDIELQEELEQIFQNGWSLLQHRFYDPNFHGKDWEALKEEYKPMALNASTKRDFRDMFNIMLGQINASHMGLYGSDLSETEDIKTGLLGVEVLPHEKGAKITHVVPESPADKSFSKLKEGEIITTVNGNEVAGNNLYQYLINKEKEEIYLEVADKEGNTRNVFIRPTNSLSREKYREWVEERKELTEKYSDGQLGYIHVQAMNWNSFERFQRELTASGHGKKGIVIDVRFNGGGWTTDYLMTVLNVQQHAYTIPRGATDNLQKNHEKYRNHYPFAERLPLSAWTKPSIAMCNQNSYSNAEIFSHAYKTLDVGTLVGTPTFGAVISTGGSRLIDGSYIRLPFRAWYVKQTNRNMEHGPAVPDIITNNEPDSKAKGRDEQLKRAVDELLHQINTE